MTTATQIDALYESTLKPRLQALEATRLALRGYIIRAGICIGIPFALFFLAEYSNMVTQSALMVTMFFGGWSFPGVPSATTSIGWGFVAVGIFLAKVLAFLFLYIWVRWTLPRFRYDQLMHLGWKVLLPLALANILIVAGALAAWD